MLCANTAPLSSKSNIWTISDISFRVLAHPRLLCVKILKNRYFIWHFWTLLCVKRSSNEKIGSSKTAIVTKKFEETKRKKNSHFSNGFQKVKNKDSVFSNKNKFWNVLSLKCKTSVIWNLKCQFQTHNSKLDTLLDIVPCFLNWEGLKGCHDLL